MSRIEQLVVLEILQVEGFSRVTSTIGFFRLEDRVEQADQGDAVLRRPEGLLEGEIVDRSDSKRHGGGGNWQVLGAIPDSMHYTRTAARGHGGLDDGPVPG